MELDTQLDTQKISWNKLSGIQNFPEYTSWQFTSASPVEEVTEFTVHVMKGSLNYNKTAVRRVA